MPRFNHYSDQELAALLRKGDRAAFTEIYDRYSPVLHRHAYRWLQDKEAVRDVIQEIFLNIWNKHEQLSLEDNLSGYLYTAVRHNVIRKVTREKNAGIYFTAIQDFQEKGENVTDHRVRENELRSIIEAEIQALPERMREVFLLSRNKHLSHADIAEQLGISEHTVSNQIKRALFILRGRLGLFLYLYMLLRK